MSGESFNTGREELLWEVFDGNPRPDYENVMGVAARVLDFFTNRPISDVRFVFANFVSRLNDLNSASLAQASAQICCDNFDFLNLRVAIIVGGPYFYSKVMEGDYSGLDDCRTIASPLRKLYYEVIGALNVIVIGGCRKSIADLDFYSDDVFQKIFRRKSVGKFESAPTLGEGVFDIGLIDSGELLDEFEFKDLGLIRVGDFLRHVKLGIFWIYRIRSNEGGGVRIDAMLKERHTSLLLVEGAGLVTRI